MASWTALCTSPGLDCKCETRIETTSTVWWDVAPCSLTEGYWHSSETSVNFYQIPRRLIQEDRTVHKLSRENWKSHESEMYTVVYILTICILCHFTYLTGLHARLFQMQIQRYKSTHTTATLHRVTYNFFSYLTKWLIYHTKNLPNKIYSS
jgi:hypothetical protein